ncbi:MAG: RNA polymerase sigma factor [Alphaproteobacteria bacterium]|nr:RNA polymerase sigma factor [Alphaproteobacteria bacterium]
MIQPGAEKLAYAQLADTELIACLLSGKQQAFRAIMERYNQRLYRAARGIVGDDAEAEDVVQESWMRAFAAISGFRAEASLLTWLTRIVINEARGRLRKRRPQSELAEIEIAQQSESVVLEFPGGGKADDPEVIAARTEARILIERAVDRLPEPFRLVFLLRDMQGCSIAEAAAILEVRPETIKTRLFRARKMLREDLDKALADALHGSFPFLGHRCERLTQTVMRRLVGQHEEAGR